MAWTIEYKPDVIKDLKKLDRATQRQILSYMEDRVANAADPRDFGKPLRHNKFGLWRYRVGDYRILCEIQESHVVILVIAVGHRKRIYD